MSVFYRFQDSGLDDWDISKNYMQLGFRPGFAIQARELTQMQTILQAQITALAKRSLISGSVIDAQLAFNKVNGIWNGSVGSGYIYIEPTDKQLGYFIFKIPASSLLNLISVCIAHCCASENFLKDFAKYGCPLTRTNPWYLSLIFLIVLITYPFVFVIKCDQSVIRNDEPRKKWSGQRGSNPRPSRWQRGLCTFEKNPSSRWSS